MAGNHVGVVTCSVGVLVTYSVGVTCSVGVAPIPAVVGSERKRKH